MRHQRFSATGYPMMVKTNLALFLLAGVAALGVACGGSSPPVRQGGEVKVLKFSVEPEAVFSGEPTTLTWETSGAESIRIIGSNKTELDVSGQSPAEGSIVDHPTADTTYKLIAVNGFNTAEKEFTVKIRVEDPGITLQADPERIYVGESSSLTWTATNSLRVNLYADDQVLESGAATSGTREVSPSRTTKYKVMAIGSGTATAETTGEVAPNIEVFELTTEGRLTPGARAELRWKTVGADNLELTGGPGFSADKINPNQFPEGKMRFNVPEDGKVTLVATRGPTKESKDLPLVLRDKPVIVKAVATPSVITVGEPTDVRFEWATEDADRVELSSNPGGTIQLFGKKNVADFIDIPGLAASTLLTFGAENGKGKTTVDVLVKAVPHATVNSFKALPSRVVANEDVTLAWDVSGATLVELYRGTQKLVIDGTKSAGTTTDRVTADAEYSLHAINEAGTETVQTIQVTVGTPIIESFSKVQANVVPGAKFDLAWTVSGGRSLSVKDPNGTKIDACDTGSLATIASGGCQVTAPAMAADAAYELSVTSGANGTGAKTTKALTVAVTDGPWIKSLTASEGRVSVGGDVTITWNVENDTQNRQPTLKLVDDLGVETSLLGRNPNFGSVVVRVTAAGNRVYTLTAETAGTRIGTGTVGVVAVPLATVNLAANPSPYTPGGTPLKLSWDTAGADSIELFRLQQDGVTAVSIFKLSGTTPDTVSRIAHGEYTPPALTPPFYSPVVYRARVTNELRTVTTQEVSVPVLLPQINSFTASPRAPDGTVTLSWSTSGGKVKLDMQTSTCAAFGCTFVEVTNAAPYLDVQAGADATQVTLSQCGTTVAASEDGCGDVPLGFNFPFFTSTYGSVRAFVNGFLSVDMGTPPTQSQQTTGGFGATKSFGNIFPYWANLKLGAAPSNLYYVRKNDPVWGNYTVIQWKGVIPFSGTSFSHDFEAVLYENGSYDLRYGNMSGQKTATRGWQDTAGANQLNLSTTLGAAASLDNRSFRRVVNAPAETTLQVNVPPTGETKFRITVESPADIKTSTVTIPAP